MVHAVSSRVTTTDRPVIFDRALEPPVRRLFLSAAVFALSSSAAAAQSGTDLCLDAERFVRDSTGMTAVTEPDTIDDWRTQAMVPGCRVTAAGATRRTDAVEARDFYERIREAGWVRTPEPRDAPNEASLRFRRAGADCLFNYYTMASPLNTDAELQASDAVFLRAGERMFNILVMCTPEAPAAPRGGGGSSPLTTR
jgi:hypothetical protein